MKPNAITHNRQLQAVRRYIRQNEMLLGGEKVLLAVSGGIDSMMLLDVALHLAPLMQLNIGIAHFDHGLRPVSANDAAFVQEQGKLHQLKVFIGKGNVQELAEFEKLSIEEAARKARYTFLEKIARRHRYQAIMTAHNANDNAETVLLNLLRGSGVTGLSGIPAVRSLGKGLRVIRPLLAMERSAIEKYAEEMGVEWREDETNESRKFTRNRVRHELLPLLKEYNPGIVATLNSTAGIMASLDQYIGLSVEQSAKRVVQERSSDRLVLNILQLKHYLPAIQTELVQRVVSESFYVTALTYRAVERALGLLWKETGTTVELVNGLKGLRDRDTIVIYREPPPRKVVMLGFKAGESVTVGDQVLETELIARESVKFSRKREIEFIDADKISGELSLRTWQDGDRFLPLGLNGEKKLSDFLIDRKVPLDKKPDIMVVADGDTIVWVCGMRIDERYKLTDTTTMTMRLHWKYTGQQIEETEVDAPPKTTAKPAKPATTVKAAKPAKLAKAGKGGKQKAAKGVTEKPAEM